MSTSTSNIISTTPIDVWFTISSFFDRSCEVKNLVCALFDKEKSTSFKSFKSVHRKLTLIEDKLMPLVRNESYFGFTYNDEKEMKFTMFTPPGSNNWINLNHREYQIFWRYLVQNLKDHPRQIHISLSGYDNFYKDTIDMICQDVDDVKKLPPALFFVFPRLFGCLKFPNVEEKSLWYCQLIKNCEDHIRNFYRSSYHVVVNSPEHLFSEILDHHGHLIKDTINSYIRIEIYSKHAERFYKLLDSSTKRILKNHGIRYAC